MASNTAFLKYRFISEPDDALKCMICLEVAEEPWQHGECGRLFCKECLERHSEKKPCPNCRMNQPQYFPDNRGEMYASYSYYINHTICLWNPGKREIMSLRVQCYNAEHACTWEGTVGTLEKHVATTCQFTLLPCPNQCKDLSNKTYHFRRKEMEHHLKENCPNRHFICQYCGVKGTYATITQVHDERCEKKIVFCSNTGCTATVQRHHISQHVESECEHTVIACKYKSIGCETKLKRKDIAAHELDDALHLHMAINTVTLLKEKVTRLENNTSQLEERLEKKHAKVLKENESLMIRFVNFEERKKSDMDFTSPTFYTNQGYHMTLRVFANGNGDGEGTHVSVFVSIVQGKHDSYLYWPFVGSITIALLNQAKNEKHHSMVINLTSKHDARVGSDFGFPLFIPHSALVYTPAGPNLVVKNVLTTVYGQCYLKENTLYFKVSVKVERMKSWLQCTTNM